MSNKVTVLLTFDKNCILPAAVTIQSLINSALDSTSYDIRVFHPDIDKKFEKSFEKMLSGTPHNISFTQVDRNRFEGAPKNNKSWTEIVYYRFLAPELLPDCSRVIYSDVDVFIKSDLSSLLDEDMDEYEFGAVAAEVNAPNTAIHKYFPENKNDYIYMSGFLLMNLDRMRETNTLARIFETIKTFKDRLKFFDLDAVNLTCRKFKKLPFKYVTLEDIYASEKIEDASEYSWISKVYTREELVDARKNPAIIHYAGKRGKPWRKWRPPSYYAEIVKKLPKELKVRTARDIRKIITSFLKGGK